MDKPARIRWSILILALGATCAAIFYPVAESAEPVEARVQAPERSRPKQMPGQTPANATSNDSWEPLVADPFAARRWVAPPVVVTAPEVATIAVAPQEPVVPAGPPALPYQFVGQMSDGAERLVYLARGEQALIARPGDVLESTYKVLKISNSQLDLEHIPSGQKQSLPIPAPSN